MTADEAAAATGGAGAQSLLLDWRGRIRPWSLSVDNEPIAVAREVCEQLGPLLSGEIEPVAIQVAGNGEGPIGLAMVKLRADGTVRFRASAAPGTSRADAVVHAVLRALDLDEGVLVGAGRRWSEHDDVGAVTVVEFVEVPVHTGSDMTTELQLRMIAAMPGPGRLSFETRAAEHRVLRLPAAALAVAVRPGADILADIDDWMVNVEELSVG